MTEPRLSSGWTAASPTDADVADVIALVDGRREAGDKPVDVETVAAQLVGPGSWTRRQRLVRDDAGDLVAWVVVHDRAAGRTQVDLVAAERLDDAGAAALLAWADRTAAAVAALRGLGRTQLDASPHATDTRLTGWLAAAGYAHTRTWLQMTRPVTPTDAVVPPLRAGVAIRRVRTHADGLPVADDVQTVHHMLEESFADHFNSYRESFPEFVQRLREDPWHRWDHWWIADVEVDGDLRPGGTLVGSVSPPDAGGALGSYVDYIGVHRRARGRGVAKALLATVVADAAERGRRWVGLEVDADSPTGADGLYRSLGWTTSYETQSWHRYVDADRVGSGPAVDANPADRS